MARHALRSTGGATRAPLHHTPRRRLAATGQQRHSGGPATEGGAPAPEACLRRCIAVGAAVDVVTKEDQRTGRRTRGRVQDILTGSPEHPRGIKVRLAGGVVGRVRALLGQEGAGTSGPPERSRGPDLTVGDTSSPRDPAEGPGPGGGDGGGGTPFAALLGLRTQLLERQARDSTTPVPGGPTTAGSAPNTRERRERQGAALPSGRPASDNTERGRVPEGGGGAGQLPQAETQDGDMSSRGEQATGSAAPVEGLVGEGSATPGAGGLEGRKGEGARKGRTPPPPGKVSGGRELFVFNLSREVTREEFATVMRSTPGVARWRFVGPEPGQAGQCRGYGFCTASSEEKGMVCGIIEHLERVSLHGKPWRAKLSAPSGRSAGDGSAKPQAQEGTATRLIDSGDGKEGGSHGQAAPGRRQQHGRLGDSPWVVTERRTKDSGADKKRLLETLSGLQQAEHAAERATAGGASPAHGAVADVPAQREQSIAVNAAEKQAPPFRTAGEQILAAMEQAALDRARAGGGGERRGRSRSKGTASGSQLAENSEGQRPVKEIVLDPNWATRLAAARRMLEDVKRLVV